MSMIKNDLTADDLKASFAGSLCHTYVISTIKHFFSPMRSLIGITHK